MPEHINIHVLLDALVPTVGLHEALSCRQLYILGLLKAEDRGDPIDFQVLCNRMKVHKPAITRALDKLEEMGLVWRTKYEDDRRRAYITLTVLGHELIEKVLG